MPHPIASKLNMPGSCVRMPLLDCSSALLTPHWTDYMDARIGEGWEDARGARCNVVRDSGSVSSLSAHCGRSPESARPHLPARPTPVAVKVDDNGQSGHLSTCGRAGKFLRHVPSSARTFARACTHVHVERRQERQSSAYGHHWTAPPHAAPVAPVGAPAGAVAGGVPMGPTVPGHRAQHGPRIRPRRGV